jgi:Nif-specific regulatory protein
MTARLTARAGPLDGAAFPLRGGEYAIGRDKTNALCLAADSGASRLHCEILEQDHEFTIRDLDSLNGTYVNDVGVQERRLEHGDEIRIGNSIFVFLVDGQPPPRNSAALDLDEGDWVSGPTITLKRSDTLHLRAETLLNTIADLVPSFSQKVTAVAEPGTTLAHVPAGMPLGRQAGFPSRPARPAVQSQPDRVARMMKSILQVCRAVSSTHRLDELQRSLLGAILDAIPAGRAAILLVSPNSNDFTSALHRTRSGEEGSFRIPRMAIQHVLDDRSALCVNDLLQGNVRHLSQTIQMARISSLIAVPIVAAETLLGVIYVDVSDPPARFGEEDLELLTGIAEASAAPLANALKADRLEHENERLLVELAGHLPLVGSSEPMRAVHRFIIKVAASDSTVLVSGASGTGKELVARAIHRSSPRSGKPFVAINCAAVTDTLLESEFFGHEKGAYTGAFAQKKGKLEEADGGTVFLDEIGELALPLQAKLLRALQEREFERVGGTRPIKVNIRVIAATNRNLEQEVRRGAFRQDLYFRLNVVSVRMPELRERREDIPLLAKHFLLKHAKTCGRRVARIADDALSSLIAYDWPGNVRELENAIERAIVLGTTDQVLVEDLPESIAETGVGPSPVGAKFHETIREIKKQLVTKALDDANRSHVDAARRLGLHPNNLHRLMKTLNLK